MRRVASALGLVWLVGLALTVLHVARPSELAFDSPASFAVLETTAALGGCVLAALAYGRWRQRGTMSDIGACYALGILALGNVLFAVVPLMANPTVLRSSVHAAAVVSGATAACLLAVASLTPERASEGTRRGPQLATLALLTALGVGAVTIVGTWVANDFGALPGLPSEATGDRSNLALTVVQCCAGGAFAVASARFMRRARQRDDRFLGWLAVTAALWAMAKVNYALSPEHLANYLTVGDWLRLGAYAVAVVAAAVELQAYWSRLAETAVLEERRRIARDLHDGLAQELAFIATQSRSIASGSRAQESRVVTVARSAERALDESRRAIAALSRPIDEPLDAALAQQAEELGGRMGVRVLLELEHGVSVSNDKREALLRIAREAITNAGRHGRPSKIVVQLADHDGVTLRIADDGRGFRPDDPKFFLGDRWGVAGMRERAESLGGRFSLDSRPYGGTRVEVWVP